MIKIGSDLFQEALRRARMSASSLLHDAISTEHLLLGLLASPENQACQLLQKEFNVSPKLLHNSLHEKMIPGLRLTQEELPYTQDAYKILKEAAHLSRAFEHPHLGTEHLLLALALKEKTLSAQLLKEASVSSQKLRECIEALSTQPTWLESVAKPLARRRSENLQSFFKRQNVFVTIFVLLCLGPISLLLNEYKNFLVQGPTYIVIVFVMLQLSLWSQKESSEANHKWGKIMKLLAILHASAALAISVVALKEAQAFAGRHFEDPQMKLWLAIVWCWGISAVGYLAGDAQCKRN